MARVLSFSKVDAYFQELADTSISRIIAAPLSRNWLIKWQLSAGIQSPILVFFDYFGKLSGNEQRTFNNRSLFFYLFSQVPADDFPAQRTAIDTAEEIGLEVLSR
jgi:hypothetical protein